MAASALPGGRQEQMETGGGAARALSAWVVKTLNEAIKRKP